MNRQNINTFQVVEREAGDWTRFNNCREVGGYTGLLRGGASGQNTRPLSITRHVSVRLRTALVEPAWRLLLCGGTVRR